MVFYEPSELHISRLSAHGCYIYVGKIKYIGMVEVCVPLSALALNLRVIKIINAHFKTLNVLY